MAWMLLAAGAALAEQPPSTAIRFEQESGAAVRLRGRDARQQLVVSSEQTDGSLRDVTRDVTYSAEPEGIVSIDAAGLVTPLADGDVQVRATLDASEATMALHVENIAQPAPVNFKNQVVPIFTKLGCNSGGCHGKSGGQNGFRLSLLGFDPEEDYEFLKKESRGRRTRKRLPGCWPGTSFGHRIGKFIVLDP